MTVQDYDLILPPEGEPILAAIARGDFADNSLYHLRLQAERLSLVQGFDALLSLEAIAVQPFPFQARTAQTALRRFRGRGLLCDEVGLGKTIEAGLVLKEYTLRGLVKKVLILTPPGLVQQWREEMASKFLLEFITHDDRRFQALGDEAWEHFDWVIASLATARLMGNRQIIQRIPYDMVIIDEAHHLKNRATVSWRFVNSLQKKYVLMLTATPVQNNLTELYNLITVLKPGQLKTEREFKRQFVVRGDPRSPKNRGLLRDLLADVMVRNTRDQVNVRLPRRRAYTIHLKLTPEEQTLYEGVSHFVRDAFHTRAGGVQKLILQTLQREVGSSAMAVQRTLARLTTSRSFSPQQREETVRLSEEASMVSRSAKAQALLRLLAANNEKSLIFTHFLATLDYLAQALEGAGHSFVVYRGDLTQARKDEAIAAFEGPAQILLSTEAAGEGRNLQFCHRMINYDLPWNPMRIEQRVGRIHRIGQAREVEIYNLSAEGTIEDHILRILDSKINMFELVIGEMDTILGNMADERDFDDIVLDIWARSQTVAEIEAGMEALGEELVQARQAYETMKHLDEALFGEDFGVE